MKNPIILLACAVLLTSCVSPAERDEQDHSLSNLPPDIYMENKDSVVELTAEQQSAINALDTIQVNTDERNRLYSTFAGMTQPCYPPDTHLTISQAELLTALKQFVTTNCSTLKKEKRDELAAKSVLAQEQYSLALCFDKPDLVSFSNGIPRSGTWVLPGVLGRRDVVFIW